MFNNKIVILYNKYIILCILREYAKRVDAREVENTEYSMHRVRALYVVNRKYLNVHVAERILI